MLAAVGWGALAASSLVLGALLAFARRWPKRQVGLVLAFGAGALISAVSFELAAEGIKVGSLRSTAIGLGVGALTYYAARRPDRGRAPPAGVGRRGSDAGTALALGAFLDGIPEQLVLGIGLAAGDGVGIGLLVAIFVSNLPEAIGSASEMERAGRSPLPGSSASGGPSRPSARSPRSSATRLADAASGELTAAIDGFAAGALLVMLIDSMIPEATRDSGRVAGLVTTLGFAVATALSSVS